MRVRSWTELEAVKGKENMKLDGNTVDNESESKSEIN